MSEFEGHTPGPWAAPYYDKNPGDRGWWIHNGQRGSDEYAVCVTFDGNPCAEADAYLIASAPSLLAERDQLRAEVERLRGVVEGLFEDAYEVMASLEHPGALTYAERHALARRLRRRIRAIEPLLPTAPNTPPTPTHSGAGG